MLLSARRLDAVFPQQREAVQSRFPVDRAFPFADHIAQCQVHHLQGRVLAGKSHPRFQRFRRLMFSDSTALVV